MESDNLLVRLFFFFFFVHDNEADYFLSSDGRVGKNEFTDVSFHAGFFFLRLEIGFVHKPPTVPKVFFTYLQSSILVFFPSLFSISTVLLCLPCPRTLTFFRLSLLFFPRSVLLLSFSLSGYFVSICTVYPDLHRCYSYFLPGKSFPWIAFNPHRFAKQ